METNNPPTFQSIAQCYIAGTSLELGHLSSESGQLSLLTLNSFELNTGPFINDLVLILCHCSDFDKEFIQKIEAKFINAKFVLVGLDCKSNSSHLVVDVLTEEEFTKLHLESYLLALHRQLYRQQNENSKAKESALVDFFLHRKRIDQEINTIEKFSKIGSYRGFIYKDEFIDLYWSPGLYGILEISIDEKPDYNKYVGCMHPEDVDASIQDYIKAKEERGSFDSQYRLVLSSGEIKHVNAKGKIEEIGADTFEISGIVTDVTDIVMATQKIQKQNDDLLLAQRIGNLGFWTHNIHTGEVIWSEEVHNIYGLSEDEFNNSVEDVLNCIPKEDVDLVMNEYYQSIKTKCDGFVKHRVVQPSGDIKFVEERWRLDFDEKGEVIGFIGTVLDRTNSQKAQNALRKTSQKLQLTLNSINEMIFVLDDKGVFIDFLGGSNQKLGFDKNEFLGKSFKKVLPIHLIQFVKDAYKYFKKNETPITIEYPDNVDRPEKWYQTTLSSIYKDDKFIGLTAVEREITDEMKAKIALTKSEDQYRSIFENIQEGYMLRNAQGKVLKMNPEGLRLFGVKSIDELPENIFDWIYHTDDRPSSLEVATSKNYYRGVLRKVQRADGEYFIAPFNKKTFVDENGEVLHESSFHDITDLIKTQKELEKQRNQFQNIVQSLPGIVFRINANTWQFEYVSEYLVNLLGYENKDFANKNIVEVLDVLVHSEDKEDFVKTIQSAVRNQDSFTEVLRVRKKIGGFIWLSATGRALVMDNQIFVDGFFYDISERVLEEERIMNAVLEASDKEKARISKDIHDSLQQTLTIASLNLEFIENERSNLSKLANQKLDLAWQNLQKSMRDSRSIAHSLMPKAISDFGWVAVQRDAIVDLNKSSGINFEFHTNFEQRLKLHIENNLYKIVQEAINNIIKHSQAQNVTIQYLLVDNKVQLIIEDDGIGFNKAESDKENQFGLVGIKSRVMTISGSLFIDTVEGHGTTLIIDFPFTNLIKLV